ncbi:hypothetical protein [Streptomyces sp. TLI_146]|uniref:Rv1733c family protein n=1 Tax=Streptomyces sp. TLI_146 TaxID=1938858 RepID=UPI000C70F543|nr:hypothetical protein [Streptomyces sp. TLI_146]PKV83140.1 hypothetical protein BX283_0634 [Streptomyces sp. TLI_146]
MSGSEYARQRLWRWRNNPLRRRHDIVEAWLVLAVWTVVVVGGTVAGLTTAHAADAMFARQRAERRSVRAVLLSDVPRDPSAPRGTPDRRMAPVRWTAPDGSPRTGRGVVNAGLTAGSQVTLWQDSRGRLTLPPTSSTAAAIEAGSLGTAAAAVLGGLVFGAGTIARWRLDRRRMDAWGCEWELVGPRWGNKTG